MLFGNIGMELDSLVMTEADVMLNYIKNPTNTTTNQLVYIVSVLSKICQSVYSNVANACLTERNNQSLTNITVKIKFYLANTNVLWHCIWND
jgi:hypothetical protein